MMETQTNKFKNVLTKSYNKMAKRGASANESLPKKKKIANDGSKELESTSDVPGEEAVVIRKLGIDTACDRCVNTNVVALIEKNQSQVVPECGRLVTQFRSSTHDRFKDDCIFCQLLQTVAPKDEPYSLELRLYEGFRSTSGIDKAMLNMMQSRLAILEKSTVAAKNHQHLYQDAVSRGFIVPFRLDKERLPVHQVSPRGINYKMFQEWIDLCVLHHPGCSSAANCDSKSIQLLVVDCLEGTVVPLPPDEQYIALSYVWGENRRPLRFEASTAEHGRFHHFNLAEAPLTIKDAVQFTNGMGRRYLWIDRYCIPQGDEIETRQAISSMNKIYSGAEFTIVALHGDDVHAGLPGVSAVSRLGPQRVDSAKIGYISTLHSLPYAISQSKWAQRGWTYQEARLSRRCIFFGDYQIYFACRSAMASEAFPNGTRILKSGGFRDMRGLYPGLFANTSSFGWTGVCLDRAAYSRRTLSYQQDALDAFRGLLRTYPYITLWGIPVSRPGWGLDPCAAFAMGLLWKHELPAGDRSVGSVQETSCRRPGFPTWSWTGIVGEITQSGVFGAKTDSTFYANFLDDFPGAKELDTNEDKFVLRVHSPTSELSLSEMIEGAKTNMISEESNSVIVEGDIVRIAPTESRTEFQFCLENGTPIPGNRIYASYDLEKPDPAYKEPSYGALVLVNWNDGGTTQHERRFVLMLLHWVDGNTAERVGLLGEYDRVWTEAFVDSIPRRRKRLELR